MNWNDRRNQIWREMTTNAIANALDELCRELIAENARLRKRDEVGSSLLKEWLNTPFFQDERDWQLWVDEFAPRVKAAIELEKG